jgi:hypothetical protein
MEAQQAEGTSGGSPLLDGWLTRAQLAAELGVSPDTLERWDRRRIGPPCARIGRATLYRAQAVREWLVAREVAAPSRSRKKEGAQ